MAPVPNDRGPSGRAPEPREPADAGKPARPVDPETGSPAEVRAVQPFQAHKTYQCPGCNQDIGPGLGHVVVVPIDAVDLRRHWHRPCWDRRDRRRPGRPTAR